MRYSDELIDEVRETNDIVDVIGQYVRLTKKGLIILASVLFMEKRPPHFQ